LVFLFSEMELQICAILLKNSEWATCRVGKRVERVKVLNLTIK
jgi:hypothetical protein